MEKFRKILFLVVGIATVLEYTFVQGMFTGPLMLILSVIVGVINVIWEIKDKQVFNAMLYLLTTAALSMGYLQLM